MTSNQCTRCGNEVPGYEGVHQSDGKGGDLGFVCGRCWTEILSEHSGQELTHLEVDPISIEDFRGQAHVFNFRYNPVPRGLRAFEVKEGAPCGYEFSVMAEGDETNVSLVGRLLEKVRKGLSCQNLEPCDITTGGLAIKDMTVRGRIEWDEEEDARIPCLIIDGKPISWKQFGYMLKSFEGWQFRLEILDESEEN